MEPLLIAGGGAGSEDDIGGCGTEKTENADAILSVGDSPVTSPASAGGQGGAAGGFIHNGGNENNPDRGGISFLNGATGGTSYDAFGGFGGGGSPWSGAGGGGGYVGGSCSIGADNIQ